MADANKHNVQRFCNACEGCGEAVERRVKGLCSTCSEDSKAYRRFIGKRRRNGRTHLPPRLVAWVRPVAVICECSVCGKAYRPKRSDRTTCCSRECGWKWLALKASRGRVRVRKVIPAIGQCETCGRAFRGKAVTCSAGCAKSRAADIARRRAEAKFVPVIVECRECGEGFTREYAGPHRFYCSSECSRRHIRRIGRQVRRARKTATKSERVDPLRVFERDGYRCGICGRKTLRSKRGSTHERAPELDHIVALALGGEHTYANTQCSCRSCNAAKGAGVAGQPNLFPV